MACPDYTKFLRFTDIKDTLLMSELENNLKMFYDWALLNVHGWQDVVVPTEGVYGGDLHLLKPVLSSSSSTTAATWQAFRKDFVWEQGVDGVDQPTIITSVNVNGSDITTGFSVNYAEGHIVFDSAISISSTVKLGYSYRWAQVYVADNAPWWKELQFNSYNANSIQWTQLPDPDQGDWTIGSHHRIQMPTIIIEAITSGFAIPREMGNHSQYVNQDIEFYVFADNRDDRNKLIDICRYMDDRTIKLFSTDDMMAADAYPLNGFTGDLVNSNVYPDLVDTYGWRECRFKNTVVDVMRTLHPKLYQGVVRTTCEVIV